ncbi:MAG TPA: hypothetical protein VFR10_05250 [bacterium]|nr:hypothetical protein [bacterium]
MFSTFRAKVRPLVFLLLFTLGSAGVVFADSNYGGTDPPKTNEGAAAAVSSVLDEAASLSSVWIQLSAMLVQWIAAME